MFIVATVFVFVCDIFCIVSVVAPREAVVKFCPFCNSVLTLYRVDLTNHLTLLIVAVSRNLDQSTL